ncbi:S1C family serine protease [Neobittarella massiliensis]|nr:trypsin-like peptidase domain-containing protein [Neobittarella massiliensis]SCJ89167.1 Putative serine protease HtrA [uncultured Anaerotruncus sp.]
MQGPYDGYHGYDFSGGAGQPQGGEQFGSQRRYDPLTGQPLFIGPQQAGGPSPVPPARKARRKGGKTALLVAGMMLLSFGCGAGGALVVDHFGSGDSGGKSVLYQSVKQTGADSGGGSTADIAATVSDSVVGITTESVQMGQRLQQYVSQGAGSGVIISADGYIVTNNHVIDGAQKITVTLKDGTEYAATLVGTDAETDLAVLKIDAKDLKPAVMGSSGDLQVGQFALAIGNPLGELGGTVTDGIISALDREVEIDGQTMTLLQTNAAINPGNSGGGLFDSSGSLIGIVNAKSSGTGIEGLGFAIPIDTARPVIEELINSGHVSGRIDTGLALLDISDAQTAMQYRVSQTGVYVQQVTGANAQRAGIQAGDLILQVNGTDVATASEVNKVLSGSKVGDTVKLTIYRSGQTAEISYQLTEQNTGSSGSGGIDSSGEL